jgi:hypothetical protein
VTWTPRVIQGEKKDEPTRTDGLFGVDRSSSFFDEVVLDPVPLTYTRLWATLAGRYRFRVLDGGLLPRPPLLGLSVDAVWIDECDDTEPKS